VKELCRRQLLAKSSAAASDRYTVAATAAAAAGKPLHGSAVCTPPSLSAVTSPQSSPANVAASPSTRSPTDELARHPGVESLRSVDTASSRLTWHVAAGAGVDVTGSPRPPSNSATDAADGGAPGQQFAVVSQHSCIIISL